MVTAFILIKAQRDRIHDASQKILDIDGVTEVYSVAGPYDMVAVARARENEHLAKVVTEDLIGVEGILDTLTLFAFRQYSEHDLEAMFGVGVE